MPKRTLLCMKCLERHKAITLYKREYNPDKFVASGLQAECKDKGYIIVTLIGVGSQLFTKIGKEKEIKKEPKPIKTKKKLKTKDLSIYAPKQEEQPTQETKIPIENEVVESDRIDPLIDESIHESSVNSNQPTLEGLKNMDREDLAILVRGINDRGEQKQKKPYNPKSNKAYLVRTLKKHWNLKE